MLELVTLGRDPVDPVDPLGETDLALRLRTEGEGEACLDVGGGTFRCDGGAAADGGCGLEEEEVEPVLPHPRRQAAWLGGGARETGASLCQRRSQLGATVAAGAEASAVVGGGWPAALRRLLWLADPEDRQVGVVQAKRPLRQALDSPGRREWEPADY